MATPAIPDHDLTPEDQEAFLEYIRTHQGDSIANACETLKLGFHRKDVRRLIREDPDFDNAYRNARGYGNEQVVNTYRLLAVEGVEKPLVSAGKLVTYPPGHEREGEIVYVKEYSDRLVELGFKAYLEEGKAMDARRQGIDVDVKVSHQLQSGVTTDDLLKMLQRVKEQPALEAPEGTGEVVDVSDEPAG